MIKKAFYVSLISIVIAVIGIFTLQRQLLIGPVVLIISFIPVIGLVIASRPLKGTIPDFVFGAIDTGLLTIPALWGGVHFGLLGQLQAVLLGMQLQMATQDFLRGVLPSG